MVSINTDSMKPEAGVTAPTKGVTIDLIDHALCGTRRTRGAPGALSSSKGPCLTGTA